MRLIFLIISISLFFVVGCTQVERIRPSLTSQDRAVIADSLLFAGDTSAAVDMYFSAALLLEPASVSRFNLAQKAAEVTQKVSPGIARILLERPTDIVPFQALQVGGVAVAPDLMSGLLADRYILPDYLSLLVAESLITTDPSYAIQFLELIDVDFTGSTYEDFLLTSYRACLGAGNLLKQEETWSITLDVGSSELKSKIYHYRGMARGVYGFRDFLESFELWPAGDIHAAAYALLRDTLLADSSLAGKVADSFYSGGLWNEVYDLALNSENPSAHIVYLGARTRDRLGIFNQAVEMLEDYLAVWPNGADAPNACIYLGRDLAALGRVEEAMLCLNQYESNWPDHYRISNLPWYRGSILAENGLWEESIPYFTETVTRYPSNSTVDDAQFYICLALINVGRTEEAIEALGNFNARWTQSVYRPSSRYWYGVLKLESGDASGRGVLERLIIDKPESLPAVFAREYLNLPPWKPYFIQEPLDSWMIRNGRSPAQPPQFALDGVTLLKAGCRKWALDLFRLAEEEVGGPYKLAPFYLENDVWERGPSAAWQIWSLDNRNRPQELWQLRYPAAWNSDVVPTAARFNMDPKLLWAIMKQESAYQPSCYSTAGARGLIQMIPSTSEYVAIDNGWSESYTPDILYDPATSIMYGTACISSYGEDCNWDIPGTLAGYNGGPHNALRWGWASSSKEEFFSRITFNETKKYVEIVSHNYVIYKEIWSEY